VTSSVVTVVDSPPVFDQDLGDRSDPEGATVSLSAAASDDDGDVLTYAASGLPGGLSIDGSTGLISGTVAAGAAAGSPYAVAVTVRDGAAVDATDTFTWTIATGSSGQVLDLPIAAQADDAEESSSGAVDLNSSDIELVTDGGDVQTVGLRFTGVSLARGTTITNAYVQFQTDEVDTGPANLTVRGQAADNAATFTNATNDVSSRTRTIASVAWAPPDWTVVGARGAAQRTPNLAPVVQQIVNRSGWTSGNSLALIITGTGQRTAEAFRTVPAVLHIETSG
jgi:hypothetical protein